ncbi:MAG: hypothetical protein JNL41_05740 [Phenylobacterium sp.]|uniref:hypothetical protein n=1 Tax=Phenylobacterium sp. TaxID=1871053 RepID=UPI001A613154|nr:hypothetical protein [Phenylobacterium sp.]MBL8553760.1 hypothetical protein [Phenylobacterium sp.]
MAVSSAAPPVPPVWTVAQASVAFVLDVEPLARPEGDLVDALLFAAVLAANTASSVETPDDQVQPPLDPVPIKTVAQTLGTPFETARRRIGAMAARGVLQLSTQGVTVSDARLADPGFLAAFAARHARLRAFYDDVRAACAPPETPAERPPGAPPASSAREPPVRLANRLIWDYVLAVGAALSPVTGGPLQTLILLALARANIGHLQPQDLRAWASSPEHFARPIPATHLAEMVRLPPETTRRYALALEADGFCRRTPHGLVVQFDARRRPEFERLAEVNLANVRALFGRLRRRGLLDAWDAATG